MRVCLLLAAALLGSCVRSQPLRPKLTIASPAGLIGEPLALAAREWGITAGAAVEVVEMPAAALHEKVAADIERRGGAFDVVMIEDTWFPRLAANGNLAPLPFVPDDDFFANALEVCRYPFATGTYYAAPYVGGAQLLFYRKDLFDKYKLAAPSTWRAALSAAKKIAAAEGLHGFVLRAAVADFLPLLWAHGGDLFDAKGNVTLAGAPAVESLRFMLELGKLAPPGHALFGEEQVAQHFMQGAAAMAIHWTTWTAAMDDMSQSKVVGKFEYAPAPAAAKPGVAELRAWLLAAPTGSKNQEMALDFIRWATETEQMKLAASRGGTPARRGVFGDIALRARFRAYGEQMAAVEGARVRPRTARWNEIEQALGAAIAEAHTAAVPPDEALRRAAVEIRAILGTEAKP